MQLRLGRQSVNPKQYFTQAGVTLASLTRTAARMISVKDSRPRRPEDTYLPDGT